MGIDQQLRDPQDVGMEELTPGDHVCCIYRDDEEHASLLASYAEAGFRRGEKVVCTIADDLREHFNTELRSRGVDPEPKLSSEQLMLLDPAEFYLEDGAFRAENVIETLRAMVQRARDEGYEGLRISGSLSPELARCIDTDDLLDYEVEVDEAAADTGCVALCRFDRHRLPPDLIRRALPTHPVVGIGPRLFRNFYYTSPGRRGENGDPDAELQQWIDNLVQYDELQRQLRQTGNRYRAIFENSGTAIAIIEPNTTISLMNREFARLSGYSKEEAEGKKSWRDMVAPEDRERMTEYHRRRRRRPGSPPTAYEFRLLRKNGEVRHAFLRVEMIPGSDQSMASVMDITERKRIRQKLRKSEREKALILETSPAHIVYQNLNHDIIWANRGAARSVGETMDALQGRKCYEVWHNRQEPCEDCPVRRAKRTGQECEGEITDKTGNAYLINGRPARDDDGRMIGVVETTLQINERKEMERDLRESRQKLRALTERLQHLREDERRRLSRKIHDELGHQLTAMKIDLSRIKKQVLEDADGGTRDRALHERLDDMSEMVNEAIDSVHQVASQLRPDALDDLGLEAAVESEIEGFQERTGIDTVLHCPADTEKLEETCTTALFRICQELLSNVARHADASRAMVELDEPDDQIRLRVTDNGRGISEEDVCGDDSLGILGVRERARALGGRVSFDSEPGEKTVASVRIPLAGNIEPEGDRNRHG
ncbi:MAG: MEDS domain-containing protein [Planctomycetota bacterium]